ncbi:ParB N-terminal domain-containing protein [Streptomyces glaucosporus]|uniref:ParB N-terminal domain-containing protein n=1 Tax=Streptomyces glaucosporus TaxID=284044 RepID=A0ABN3INP0_9ACTN
MESTDRTLALPSNFTHRVRIEELLPADSPRLSGVDETHVHRLAEIYATLPPVLVHRATMRVIDGMHRIAAATLKGLEHVEVQYFDGAEKDAFLRAVAANVSHGLPLSIADRKAAARRIFSTHPDLSDRAIAACVGLDAKTVAAARRSTGDSPRSNTRIGSDGKSHPLDRTAERMHAARLMTSRPDLPLRAIVRETGLSLGTAHDVRQRLLRGESPVPAGRRRQRGDASPPPGRGTAPAGVDTAAAPTGNTLRGPREQAAPAGDFPVLAGRARLSMETLRKLARDPSLRHTESGRHLLRWLHTHFVVDDSWRQHTDAVPAHCSATVAELALQCSGSWKRFAEELSRRLPDKASAS